MLADRYPDVSASTLRLHTNSATTGIIRGSVHFHNGLELRIFEYLDLTDGEILDYSYTVFRGEEKVRWYDPQPHPDNPELASTFPHHRHEPPDTSVPEAEQSGIKHNRKPAPGITFNSPNLPTLIADCVELGKTLEADA
ncbi:MAG: hypothetical protein HY872_13125 [Chloroflexi bacterium]|nr:hypothetical protein [Chloroflexota bacterium]